MVWHFSEVCSWPLNKKPFQEREPRKQTAVCMAIQWGLDRRGIGRAGWYTGAIKVELEQNPAWSSKRRLRTTVKDAIKLYQEIEEKVHLGDTWQAITSKEKWGRERPYVLMWLCGRFPDMLSLSRTMYHWAFPLCLTKLMGTLSPVVTWFPFLQQYGRFLLYTQDGENPKSANEQALQVKGLWSTNRQLPHGHGNMQCGIGNTANNTVTIMYTARWVLGILGAHFIMCTTV